MSDDEGDQGWEEVKKGKRGKGQGKAKAGQGEGAQKGYQRGEDTKQHPGPSSSKQDSTRYPPRKYKEISGKAKKEQKGPYPETQHGQVTVSGGVRERQASEKTYQSSGGSKNYEGNKNLSYVQLTDDPDPYKKPYNASLQTFGWHQSEGDRFAIQKSKGDPPLDWKKEEILVSVNHFPLEVADGSKTPAKKFSLPRLFHQYRIDIEIIREKNKSGNAPGPSKGSNVKGKSKSAVSPGKKELPKHLAQLILKTVIPKIQREYDYYGIFTDNWHHLYTPRKLEDIMANNLQVEISLQEVEFIEKGDGVGTVKVLFTQTPLKIDTIDMAEYFQEAGFTLKGFPIGAMDKQTLESALNALVRSFPKFRYVSVGKSSLVRWPESGDGHILGGGLVAWTGVSASIGIGWKPYLNVEIANCAFWSGKNVLAVLEEIFDVKNKSGFKDIWLYDATWKDTKRLKAAQHLNWCKVRYQVGGKILGGTVRGIPWNSVSEETFFLEKGNSKKEISVFKYFVGERGAKLKYQNGPLLQLGEDKFVPAELCVIRNGQSYNRRELMSEKQTSNMLKHAQKNPQVLKADIIDQVRQLKLDENEELKTLEISIPSKMLEMTARVLVAPNIRYGKSTKGKVGNVVVVSPNREGHWETFKKGFEFYRTPIKIDKWAIFSLDGDLAKFDAFWKKLVKNGKDMGINFFAKPYCSIKADDNNINDVNPKNQNVENLCKFFKEDFKECQLVIVVLNKRNSELYGQVKHAAEVKNNILTQCIVGKTISSAEPKNNEFRLNTTVQNILLKLNSKLGGVNHVTVPPFDKNLSKQFSTLLMECPVLIMGADVTHPGPGAKDFAPSYAAVTASIDKTCMPFMTELRAQTKADKGAAEVIKDMEEVTVIFLKTFQRMCKMLPWKILYIRDGVGEGQFREVLHAEMTAIRKACIGVGGEGYQPKITFITAQKRHKTRIFHEVGEGKVAQAPPGTVIDKEIVHTTETDFYLLSHHGLQGTSRPTRYHVLWDDSDFRPEEMQSMIYTLCYMYCRCTKSVSLPAPTYYAHLAADRAKKLCEGIEDSNRSVKSLNEMLRSVATNMRSHPMHFV